MISVVIFVVVVYMQLRKMFINYTVYSNMMGNMNQCYRHYNTSNIQQLLNMCDNNDTCTSWL